MGNKLKLSVSSNAKLIAMIDLFAFISILLLFHLFTNPTEEDLALALERKAKLSEENIFLNIELQDAEAENLKLNEQNLKLRDKIREIDKINKRLIQKQEVLARKIIRDYSRVFPQDKDVATRIHKDKATLEELIRKLNDHHITLLSEKTQALERLEREKEELENRLHAAEQRINTMTAQIEESIKNTNGFGKDQEELRRKLFFISVRNRELEVKLKKEELRNDLLTSEIDQIRQELKGLKDGGGRGNFKTADVSFSGGMFKAYPVDEPKDPFEVDTSIDKIIDQYEKVRRNFKYIFIIGHASKADAKDVEEKSDFTRRARNWGYAGRRATVIANYLTRRFLERGFPVTITDDLVVIASTGESDLRFPDNPLSQENAWVEVVFCRDWKSLNQVAAN